jgi:hypothetical protein
VKEGFWYEGVSGTIAELIEVAAGVALALFAVGIAFGAVAVLGQGEQPPEGVSDIVLEQQRIREEELAKPRFEGVVNGIRLYATNADVPPQRNWACTGATPEEVEHVSMDAVAGTPMEIIPTYLPAGAEEVDAALPPVICKGTVAYVEREWIIRRDDADFRIQCREGERVVDIDASADRVSASTVRGKPAVLVEPLTPDGYGRSIVIMAEDFGFTVVSAFGLPLEETVKIAEGLD